MSFVYIFYIAALISHNSLNSWTLTSALARTETLDVSIQDIMLELLYNTCISSSIVSSYKMGNKMLH